MRTKVSTIAGLAMVLCTACTGTGPGPVGVNGYAMSDFFTFDGTCRGWEYVNTEVSLDYQMRGELQADPEYIDDGATLIHTIDYAKLCMNTDNGCVDGELIRSMNISSNRSDGTLIHSFTDAGVTTSYDPPVALTGGEWAPTEVESTTTGGATVTSEFVSLGACDIRWANWEEGCALIEVDDGGAGTGLAGQWTVATGWNVVAFELENDPGRWSLQRGIFETTEDECNDEGLPLLNDL